MAEKNDSHDDVIKRFQAELSKSSSNNAGSSEKAVTLPEDKKSDEWKSWESAQNSSREGVFSIKTKRAVNPNAPRGIVSEQKKDFESIRAEESEIKSEPAPVTTSEVAESTKESSPEFEKVRGEWKEARDRAHKIEEEYHQKYQEHVLAQTKGIRGLINVPRRVFGLQPRLNRELENLQEASLSARIDYKEAGLKLKEAKSAKDKTIGEVEKLSSRYQRMLAHHLTVAVHKERLAKQKEGRGQAWEESKYLRPTMESLGKHKYTVGAVALGAGILTAGIVPVAAGMVAGFSTRFGLGRILDKTYVESARKNLAEGKERVGNDFFEAELSDIDDEIEHLTFAVDTRETRAKSITNTAAIVAGISAAGYVNGLGGAEQVTIQTPNVDLDTSTALPPVPESSIVDNVTPETSEVEIEESPDSSSVTEVPTTEEGYSSEKLTDQVDNFEKNTNSDKLDNNIGIDSSVGRADGDVSELPRSSGSGVDRLDTNTESVSEVNDVAPEVTKDYSLPTFSSVNDLPSQGIVESVPQAPAEIPTVSQDPNLTPMTESEATATFGSTTGPSVEGLTTPEQITYTVEKGDNIWNIMEGKGSDANPVGGKSEVLPGMSLAERQDALDKLLEYAEKNPEFGKEVGAIRSDGDLNKIYPGEEINVSILDDKLRELLGIGETTPESAVTPEATVPAEEVGEVQVQPEPVAEQVVEEPEAAPEPVPVPPQPESSDAPVYESGPIINASMSSDGASSSVGEAAPVTPELIATNANEIVVNSYVAGVEKASGGFFDSLMGLSQPNVGGTFELIKGLNLNDMVSIAQSGQLPEGVSQVGWDRWVDHINDSIAKFPINAGETIGQYITRVASTRIA